MTISMYQASVPAFVHTLTQLHGILEKAESYAALRKIDPSVLVTARLYPDMFPLSRQIQIACDFAKGTASRLAAKDVPGWPDNETTLAELKARVAKTIDLIKSFKPADIDGSEGRDISMKWGPDTLKFKGQNYLLSFSLPNFYFHTGMAYAILRHNGLDIGKSDFIGTV